MPKVTLRPTIAADLPHVIGEPLPYRIRAITALVDDRVIGMGGIAFPLHGPAIAFVQLAPSSSNGDDAAGRDDHAGRSIPEARRYPVAFHRAGLLVMEMICRSEVRQVIATADADSEVAVRWLKRLGFKAADGQRIEGRILFVWNREDETVAGQLPSVRAHFGDVCATATSPSPRFAGRRSG
jgi:hypothetical protein